jgi:hypothetical protein
MHGAAAWEKVKHGAGSITVQAEACNGKKNGAYHKRGASRIMEQKHGASGSMKQEEVSSRRMHLKHGAEVWSRQ